MLPSRVAHYNPAMLDELTAAGEVVWAGAGSLPGKDGWVSLYLADAAPLLLPPPHPLETTALHESVLSTLSGGYGLFFRQIADQVRATTHPEATDPQLADALWDLAWSGRLTNDTLAPLRSVLGSGRTAGSTAHRAKRAVPRGRYGSLTAAARPASRTGPPTVAGRWSLLPDREADGTVRAHALARTLLDRHGVVTRGAVAAEGVEGGFSAVYRILAAFEESGQARRGYVVEGLGAAQFAMEGAVDRLRAVANARERGDGPAGPEDFPRDGSANRRGTVGSANGSGPEGSAPRPGTGGPAGPHDSPAPPMTPPSTPSPPSTPRTPSATSAPAAPPTMSSPTPTVWGVHPPGATTSHLATTPSRAPAARAGAAVRAGRRARPLRGPARRVRHRFPRPSRPRLRRSAGRRTGRRRPGERLRCGPRLARTAGRCHAQARSQGGLPGGARRGRTGALHGARRQDPAAVAL